jgi:hypothetical protein
MALTLSRRRLLRGLASGTAVALGLPTLEIMLDRHGEAYADGSPRPKRFGVFFFGNGVRLDRWNPSTTGAGWRLSSELAPLENVQPYVNVVSGYRAQAGYGRRGHHDGAAALLSGVPFIELPHADSSYSSKFGGPTIDQTIADAIRGNTRFPSLQLGVSRRVIGSEGPTLQYVSHRGPDQPLSAEFSPRALYRRLFGGFTPPDPRDPTNDLRVGLLDAVRADGARLRTRLGVADRRRLDAHLDGVAQLEREIRALPPELTTQCTRPDEPGEENREQNGVEPIEAVSRLMADLVTLAFACDLTRVFSLQLTGSVGYTVYDMLGQTRGNHELSHEASEREAQHLAVHWNMRQLAYLAERLAATQEGEGNLLDQTAILGTTDVAEGESHSSDDYPIVVVGRAGGALRYPGVHHRGTRLNNTSDVLLTLHRAMGTGATEVGAEQGYSNRPCAAIEA